MIKPPADTPEYARPAWASALRVSAGIPSILEAFERDTGLSYSAPRTGLDRMIDEATGAGEKVAEAYVEWFNKNVWGKWNEAVSTDKAFTDTEEAQQAAARGANKGRERGNSHTGLR